METYNTLHIFGYGETQVITKTENKKVTTDGLTKVQVVVDNVYSLKPADNPATTQYRTINIFNDLFCDYLDEQGNHFRVDYSELDKLAIDELVNEVLNKLKFLL